MTCTLDDTALAEQLRRLATIGRHILRARRDGKGVTVELDGELDDAFLHETLAIERGCCPFLALTWDDATRELTVAAA